MIGCADVAWIAGLLEGEGYFACRKKHGLTIQISMTDADVVERLARLFGFGSISRRRLKSGKRLTRWTVGTQAHCAGLMMTILPFMGERRAAKIKDCLRQWQARPGRENRNRCPTSGRYL